MKKDGTWIIKQADEEMDLSPLIQKVEGKIIIPEVKIVLGKLNPFGMLSVRNSLKIIREPRE